MGRFTVVVIALLALVRAAPATALETVYVTRHLQKSAAAAWDAHGALRPLSEKGAACAGGLSSLLADRGIAAVYSTEYARTLATGAAVSGTLEGVEIIGDNDHARPTRDLAERLGERHAADRAILVVGHSNTVADIVLAFRPAAESCLGAVGLSRPGIPETQYGDVWRVTVEPDGSCGVSRERLAKAGELDCTTP